MKKLVYIFAILYLFSGCLEEEKLTKSNLDTNKPELNEIDVFLRENFTTPYNIDVFYQWNPNKVDFNRFLFPPNAATVIPAMQAVKTIWLDTFNEVAGEDFVKLIAPREIVLVGGFNINPSGTITLGIAEGGKRITFFNTDFVDLSDRDELVRFVATIQHEYTHILNQNIPFDRETYQEITPSGYTAQWFNSNDTQARELGFISAYARSNEDEDFAEMVTALLSNSNTEYNAIIDNISSEQARVNIRSKEVIIAEYFKTEFNIDIYELQRVAAENVQKVLN